METTYLAPMRNVTLSIKRVSRRITTSYADHANSNSVYIHIYIYYIHARASHALPLYLPLTTDASIGQDRHVETRLTRRRLKLQL